MVPGAAEPEAIRASQPATAAGTPARTAAAPESPWRRRLRIWAPRLALLLVPVAAAFGIDWFVGRSSLPVAKHPAAITSIAVSAGGSFVATAAADGTLKVLDGATGRVVFEPAGELPLGLPPVAAMAFATTGLDGPGTDISTGEVQASDDTSTAVRHALYAVGRNDGVAWRVEVGGTDEGIVQDLSGETDVEQKEPLGPVVMTHVDDMGSILNVRLQQDRYIATLAIVSEKAVNRAGRFFVNMSTSSIVLPARPTALAPLYGGARRYSVGSFAFGFANGGIGIADFLLANSFVSGDTGPASAPVTNIAVADGLVSADSRGFLTFWNLLASGQPVVGAGLPLAVSCDDCALVSFSNGEPAAIHVLDGSGGMATTAALAGGPSAITPTGPASAIVTDIHTGTAALSLTEGRIEVRDVPMLAVLPLGHRLDLVSAIARMPDGRVVLGLLDGTVEFVDPASHAWVDMFDVVPETLAAVRDLLASVDPEPAAPDPSPVVAPRPLDPAFVAALAFTQRWEGGFGDIPGLGPINAGIRQERYDSYRAARALPARSVRDMTQDEIEDIYHKTFWRDSGCERLPGPFKALCFDIAVTLGPRRAVVLLQRALGLEEDGDLGPATLAAAGDTGEGDLASRYLELVLEEHRSGPPAGAGTAMRRRLVDLAQENGLDWGPPPPPSAQ